MIPDPLHAPRINGKQVVDPSAGVHSWHVHDGLVLPGGDARAVGQDCAFWSHIVNMFRWARQWGAGAPA